MNQNRIFAGQNLPTYCTTCPMLEAWRWNLGLGAWSLELGLEASTGAMAVAVAGPKEKWSRNLQNPNPNPNYFSSWGITNLRPLPSLFILMF
jgi:hypothetical protein